MKITQIATTTALLQREKELSPATQMPGAQKIIPGNQVISNHFQGFGVALTGSSCYLLSEMDPTARKHFLRSIYTKDGLNLSVARLSIGSSDYSAELYSYDDVENDLSLSHFSIDRDRAYIIPMVREVLEIRPDLFVFASPWSPPGWMKTGGSMCGGYMRAEFVSCYADYIVRFIEEYAKEGIKISAITPQNEPETQQGGRMPACIWHPEIEAAFVKELKKRLTQKGLDTQIWLYDHNFDGHARVDWQLKTFPALQKDADAVAFHYYKGAIEDTRELRKSYPHLKMHFTEGGPRLYDHYDSDFCKWGIMISKVLSEGFSSFTGWNLMLDETGGPNIGPFFCGGLVTKNSQTGEITYSGQYRALAHVAPFLQPGACIKEVAISGNEQGLFKYPNSQKPLYAALIENPDGTRTYLLVNPDTEKKQAQLFEDGAWRYVELLPESISTVRVE